MGRGSIGRRHTAWPVCADTPHTRYDWPIGASSHPTHLKDRDTHSKFQLSLKAHQPATNPGGGSLAEEAGPWCGRRNW